MGRYLDLASQKVRVGLSLDRQIKNQRRVNLVGVLTTSCMNIKVPVIEIGINSYF